MSEFISRRVSGKGLIAGLAAALTGSVLLAGAAAAGAENQDAVPSIAVHYKASMLASDQGVRELYRRLNAAAERVCVEHEVGHFISEATLACRRDAVARAVKQIDNPHLAALQASRTKSG